MKIKQNYKDDAIVVDAKNFRLIFGDNEYNLSEGENGEIEILKSSGEIKEKLNDKRFFDFDVDEGRCISEVIIKPSSSNGFSFK